MRTLNQGLGETTSKPGEIDYKRSLSVSTTAFNESTRLVTYDVLSSWSVDDSSLGPLGNSLRYVRTILTHCLSLAVPARVYTLIACDSM
jgi:hypothetical protein